jgi:hypothetical protein
MKELDFGHQELALAPVDHCLKLALSAVVNLPGVIFQESALEWDVSSRLLLGTVLMMGVATVLLHYSANSVVAIGMGILIYILILF